MANLLLFLGLDRLLGPPANWARADGADAGVSDAEALVDVLGAYLPHLDLVISALSARGKALDAVGACLPAALARHLNWHDLGRDAAAPARSL